MSKRQVLLLPLLSGISLSLYYYYQRYINKYNKRIICDTSYKVYRQLKKEFDSNVKIVKQFKIKPLNRITIQNYKSNIHFHNIDDLSQYSLNKIKNVLNEIGDTPQGQYMLGRLKQNKLYNHQDGDEAYIGQYAADQRKKSNYDLKKLRDAHQQGFADQWDKNHKK